MALSTVILEGNKRKFTATFKVPDENGVPTDPTTVTFFRQKLDDASDAEAWVYVTDVEVLRESEGVFTIELSFPDDGSYAIGAEGTDACEAYDEVIVEVENARARP